MSVIELSWTAKKNSAYHCFLASWDFQQLEMFKCFSIGSVCLGKREESHIWSFPPALVPSRRRTCTSRCSPRPSRARGTPDYHSCDYLDHHYVRNRVVTSFFCLWHFFYISTMKGVKKYHLTKHDNSSHLLSILSNKVSASSGQNSSTLSCIFFHIDFLVVFILEWDLQKIFYSRKEISLGVENWSRSKHDRVY